MSESKAKAAKAAAAEKPKHPFEAGIDLYYAKKPENDIDVIGLVRQAMVDDGFTEHQLSRTFDVYRHITASRDRISPVQRTNVNRFFTLAFPQSVESFREVQADMIDNGPMHVWLDVIKKRVLPFVKRNNLLGSPDVQAS